MDMEARKKKNKFLRAIWNQRFGKIPVYPKNKLKIPLHKAIRGFVRVINDRVLVDVSPFTAREKIYLLHVVAALGFQAQWTDYQF